MQVARQSVTGRLLEPCNVSVTMASTAGTGDVTLEVTKLKLNVSVDVLELVLSLQSSVLDPLVQPSPDKCAAPARDAYFTLTLGGAEASRSCVLRLFDAHGSKQTCMAVGYRDSPGVSCQMMIWTCPCAHLKS